MSPWNFIGWHLLLVNIIKNILGLGVAKEALEEEPINPGTVLVAIGSFIFCIILIIIITHIYE